MKICYKTKKLEKECTDLSKAKKTYGEKVSEKLFATIEFIQNAVNLQDIIENPSFHFHKLLGKRKGEYAIDLGRKLGFRLIIIPLDTIGNQYNKPINTNNAIEIVSISVEEVSNHYE